MTKKKEFKVFKFKVQEADSEGSTGFVKGYASTYGNIDQGDDVIEKGAFRKTIQEQKAFPMLLDHDPRKPAGYQKVREDDRGLYFESELKLYDPEVKQRYELSKLALKYEAPMGVSIGYSAIKFSFDETEGRTIRNLEELRLFETSLVTFPMNEMATVTDAKSESLLWLFDIVQTGRYSLNEIKEALSQLEQSSSTSGRAANKTEDPALRQSLEALSNVFK